MITQKFIDMTNKVLNEVEYRHINEAFDCLIDTANADYEREEGVFSEIDFE
jgi:hypothetical protein